MGTTNIPIKVNKPQYKTQRKGKTLITKDYTKRGASIGMFYLAVVAGFIAISYLVWHL